MGLLQFRKHTFMQICTRTLYSHIILPNLNTSAVYSHISYSAYLEWRDPAAPTLTVALLSRRYIVKEDYLVRKFSSLATIACPARAIVAPFARSFVLLLFPKETKYAVGRLAKPSAHPSNCSFHVICIAAASTE